jgi:tRNA dimethylallyltransferase
MKNRIIFIVGPTATGKSETAFFLAKKINAEIVSCDSMQIYKNMDIITAKSAKYLRKNVLHHLIDVLPPSREYSVFRYSKDAIKKVREITKKGKVPVFAGGTGLYVSVLLDGIFEEDQKEKSIRARLYKEADRLGSISLHKRLSKVDPEAALKIHPNDTRRIVRALEVFEKTGKPISLLQKQRKGLSQYYDIIIFGLNMDRDKLYERIDGRVEGMFKKGLVGEAKKLLKLRLSKTARSAIGLKELKGYFDGLCDLDTAKNLIKQNTRRYAKRQLTWFRKDERVNWVNINATDKPKDIADTIWKRLCL